MKEKCIGKSLRELTADEMKNIYGLQYNSQPQSVLASLVLSFVGTYLSSAAFRCGKDNKD